MTDSSPENVAELDSPTDTSTASATQTPVDSDATPAASSTAEKPAETLLDRVKSTLDKMREDSPASEPRSGAAQADPPPAAKTEGTAEGLSVEESKNPKTRERFGKLTADLKAANANVERLRGPAEEFDKIEAFIRNAGLTREAVGGSLQMAALLVSDPRAARERLLPIMAELDRVVGETLPPALQSRVDQGFLTIEDAKALNRASADADLAKRQVAETNERSQRDSQAREQRTAIDSTLGAVDGWEKQKAARDPDWHQKQPEVSELVELAVERKSRELQKPYWPTSEEAVKLAEAALETVEKRFKRFSPKPRAIDPPVTPGASPRSSAPPKNTMDIIRRVVGAT